MFSTKSLDTELYAKNQKLNCEIVIHELNKKAFTITMWFICEQPVSCHSTTHIKQVHHSSQASWKRTLNVVIFSLVKPIHLKPLRQQNSPINLNKHNNHLAQKENKTTKSVKYHYPRHPHQLDLKDALTHCASHGRFFFFFFFLGD